MRTHIDIEDLRELSKERLDRVLKFFTDDKYDLDEIYKFIHKKYYRKGEETSKYEELETFCESINVSNMLGLIHEFDHDFKLQYSGNRWIIDLGKHIREESKQVVYAYWKVTLKIADIFHEKGEDALIRNKYVYKPQNNEIKHHVTTEDLIKISNYGLERVLEAFIDKRDEVEIARRSITSRKYRSEKDDSWTKEEIEDFCKRINATNIVEKLEIYDQDIRIQKFDGKWHVRAGSFTHKTENLIDALFRILVKIADNTNTYSELPKREFEDIKERINESLENNLEIYPYLLETYNKILCQTDIDELLKETKEEPKEKTKPVKETKKKSFGELIAGLFKKNNDTKSENENNNENTVSEDIESKKHSRCPTIIRDPDLELEEEEEILEILKIEK